MHHITGTRFIKMSLCFDCFFRLLLLLSFHSIIYYLNDWLVVGIRWFISVNIFSVCPDFSACSGQLTSLTGVIQSPNFPRNYSNGLNCVYVITVPDTYRVTLTFETFEVEKTRNCYHDYVEVSGCWCSSWCSDCNCRAAHVVVVVVVIMVMWWKW